MHRKVRILRPANTASQQGFTGIWKIEFECTTKWLNPLMGWTSTKDMAHQLTNALQFATKDEAVAFAEREGFEYDVEPEHLPKPVKKSYSDNYRWKGPAKVKKQKDSGAASEQSSGQKQQTSKA